MLLTHFTRKYVFLVIIAAIVTCDIKMIPKNHLWLGMILNDQFKFNYCELHPQKDRKPLLIGNIWVHVGKNTIFSFSTTLTRSVGGFSEHWLVILCLSQPHPVPFPPSSLCYFMKGTNFDKSGRKEVKSRKKQPLNKKIMEVLVKPGQRESAEIL